MDFWVASDIDKQFSETLQKVVLRLPAKFRQQIGIQVQKLQHESLSAACDPGGLAFVRAPKYRKYHPGKRCNIIVIPVLENNERWQKGMITNWTAPAIHTNINVTNLELSLRQALLLLQQKISLREAEHEIKLKESHIHTLNELGANLTREPHLETLLTLIVTRAREIMHADAGSLYMVETDHEKGEQELSFLVAQNDSLDVPFKAFRMPMSIHSIAGYVAVTGEHLCLEDVYCIDSDAPYQFNNSFDRSVGYRTKSMLVIPMLTHDNDVIGVLQLINKKEKRSLRFSGHEEFEAGVLPFTDEDTELGLALGSQAAIAVENAQLYGEIQRLLESFMHASVKAIEARDPTTSGHSERVADYSVDLAKFVDRVDKGRLAKVSFSRTQLEQLYFAGILHDFGKIGVREDVLIKAKKLYPHQMQAVSNRFHYMRRVLEIGTEREKVKLLTQLEKQAALAQFGSLEKDLKKQITRLDQAYKTIIEANEPTILHQEEASALKDLLSVSIQDVDGTELPLLFDEEYANLSIGKGSLNESERLEIESHVTHTYNFLKMIPWTRELRDVPAIAHGHHEKLDGTGYPQKLHATQIAMPIRIMTVSDIFDALTAQDRPYKRAVPTERALNILEMEVKEGKLDSDIVKLFIESKTYETVLGKDN